MNGKKLLEEMNDIDMKYVEEASYPKKRRLRRSKMGVLVACLVVVLGLGTAAYASGTIGAVRAYFSTQNSNADSLLNDGTISTEDGEARMWVDNFIADEEVFVFTVSMSGMGNDLNSGELLESEWVTRSGERISVFNKEVGAYTEGFGRGDGGFANALSMYEDADATFLMIYELPEGYTMDDMTGVEINCRGLSMIAEVGDDIIENLALEAAGDNAGITNFTASAIGFSFTADHEVSDICMIRNDGTYDYVDDGEESEGFHGYLLSTSSDDGTELLQCRGRWGGDEAISVGILDMDMYSGMCIDGVEYYFVR